MTGYSRLATLMGNHRDLAIVRRFSVLNAKNLLYLQGEITHLEAELESIASENQNSRDTEKNAFEHSITTMMGPHKSEDGRDQWGIILEIREKLKEYNEAMCRFRTVCSFEKANKSDIESLRNWLYDREGGNLFLRGYEAETWDKLNEEDLVCMTNRYQDKDIIAKWIDIYLIPLYHRAFGHRIKDPEKLHEGSSLTTTPLYYYPDSTIHAIIDTISTVLAALLPTISAFILYLLHSPIVRLGGIVAATVLCSMILAVIARAKRIECFAVTNAFAAVLVVFVANASQPA